MSSRTNKPHEWGYHWALEIGDPLDVDVMLVFIDLDLKTIWYGGTKFDVSDFEWFERFDGVYNVPQ